MVASVCIITSSVPISVYRRVYGDYAGDLGRTDTWHLEVHSEGRENALARAAFRCEAVRPRARLAQLAEYSSTLIWSLSSRMYVTPRRGVQSTGSR
jgi:hypothetical protein